MMTRIQKLRILTGCIVALGTSTAWAGVGVDLLGAGTYSMGSGSPTPAAALGIPGGGLRLNFRLGSKFDMQMGGFYLTRAYNNGAARTMTLIDGQFTFRYKFGKVVSLNFGGYGNYILTSSQSVSNRDYGLTAGLGIRIPFGASFGLLLEPQYHFALSNLSPPGGSLTPHELLFLVGFAFGSQGGGK